MKKTVIKIALLLVVVVAITACGAKKKITSINKGYSLEKVDTKADVKKESAKVSATDKTESEQIKEVYDKNTVVQYIFDTAGRVQSITKTTNEKGTKDTSKETEIKQRDSFVSSVDSLLQVTGSSEVRNESKAVDKEVKQSNPIWHWIGVGVFVLILAAGLMLWVRFK